MKRFFALIAASALTLTSLSACQGAQPASAGTTTAAPEPAAAPTVNNAPITVISREDGSGTRGAFVEMFGILDDDDVDRTTVSAEITNNTSVMMTSVVGNPNAIGYISLGSLNDTVKAAKIDGVDASVANINNGTYTVSRPFIIATKGEAGGLARDFIDFILSADGQDIIEEEGYIRVADTGAFAGSSPSGNISVAGSSSVSPVMEVLIEAYQAVNTGADIELQTSDSSAGMSYTIEGVSEIGMSSRELKDTELSGGLVPTTIAIDGIAVIVNKDNAAANLTKDQVKGIFTGEITEWSALN